MKHIYKLSDESGNILKEVEYVGDQALLDQLQAFSSAHGITFGSSLHDALADVENYLASKGAKFF